MFINEDTIDDLLHGVFTQLLKCKAWIHPKRGRATERLSVLLQLTNPRARLSRTETKARLARCLGELLWYLAGIKVTRDLIRAGQLLKIDVLDHVIIGRATPERTKDYSSLRELGYFYS